MALDPIYDFAWEVRASGYAWITTEKVDFGGGEAEPGRYLTSGVPWGTPYERRFHYPLVSDQQLFRKFAALFDQRLSNQARLERLTRKLPWDESAIADFEASIVAFANEYGSLTNDGEQNIILDKGSEKVVGGGESINLWAQQVEAMHKLVSALKHGARDVSRESVPKLVNEHIAGKVSPRLLWLSSAKVPRLVIRMVPSSLLGALWLQAALAVDETRQCVMCGKSMEVSDSGRTSRPDRQTCSEKCRSAYHRASKEIKSLAKQGLGPREIEERLERSVPYGVIHNLTRKRRRRKAG